MARDVKVAIVGDSRGLKRAFDRAERDAAGFAGKMKAVGASVRSSLTTWAPIAGAALVGFGVHAINVASDVEEAGNKIDVVFGKSADAVKAFGEDAANAMGMSQREYLQFAGRIGALVKPMGATEERAAEMSTTMTKLAADLGSFHNVDAEEALVALASAMSGEMEPMKRFGVVLNDAALKTKALELGLYSGKGTLDAYAKSQAAYALILEQTGDAQGDFERTVDGTANKTKLMQAKFEDLTAELGEKLLPVANTVLDGLIAGLDWATVWWEEKGSGWLEDFRAGLDRISEWWESDGSVMVENFKTNWALARDDFDRGWRMSVEDFKLGWRDFMAGLTWLWGGVVQLGRGFAQIGEAAWWVLSTIGRGFANFADFVWGLITSIGSGISWLVDRVTSLADRLGSIGGTAGRILNPGGSAIGWALDQITSHDNGGVIPGPVGAARLAVVHGGETVLPTHKQNMSVGPTVVQLVVDGRVFTEQVVEPNLAKSRRAHTGSRRIG